MTHPGERWGIWIDVEGFSNLWSAGNLSLRGLGQLTSMIFAVGRDCYSDEPDRLFAYQMGDAFYIASDFHETSLDRCAALAVVLMRGMTEVDCVARASIAEGELADYSGCRPRAVQAEASRNGDTDFVAMGNGLMTLQAVTGQGVINAVALDQLTETKGSLLSISAKNARRLSAGFVTRPVERSSGTVAIDCIHSTSERIDEIIARSGLPDTSPTKLIERITAYVSRHGLPDRWSEPTFQYAGIGLRKIDGDSW